MRRRGNVSHRLEKRKLTLELTETWIKAGTLLVTVLVAGGTLSFQIWSEHEQSTSRLELQKQQVKAQLELQRQRARDDLELQKLKAKLDAELKAGEIAMNADNPYTTLNRARALRTLLPHRIPPDFGKSFQP